jgi:putative salt-induced outer membrane protein
VIAVLAAPCSAVAQAAPEPRSRTTFDLGVVNASGNTRLRSLNAAEQFVFRTAPWTFTQTFNIVNGSTNGVESANSIRAGARADYAVIGHLRAYGIVLYERNRFAGIARRFEESVGATYAALTGPRHVLDLEGGVGNNQQRGTSGPVEAFWLGRVAGRYRFTFRTTSHVEEKLEVLQNLETAADTRINSELTLVAPLTSRIALRFGYTVRFDNQPEPTFKKTDQVVSSGVQIVL